MDIEEILSRIHEEMYSTKETYCKYQRGCEHYDNSCRYGERTISDCQFAEKIIRAEHSKYERGYKV